MIALGIGLPFAFHLVGLGKVFLPMHIPVLLCGFLTDSWTALFVGALTPVLSAVLTGMPTLVPPVAQAMTVELTLYGVLSSFFYRKMRWNVYVSLALAMLAGRLVYGVLGVALMPLLNMKPVPILYPVTIGLAGSVPGLILQIIVVPPLVAVAEKSIGSLRQRRAHKPHPAHGKTSR
jgi:hypothetical protein